MRKVPSISGYVRSLCRARPQPNYLYQDRCSGYETTNKGKFPQNLQEATNVLEQAKKERKEKQNKNSAWITMCVMHTKGSFW